MSFTPAGLHQYLEWWVCNACGKRFMRRSAIERKAARDHVRGHKAEA